MQSNFDPVDQNNEGTNKYLHWHAKIYCVRDRQGDSDSWLSQPLRVWQAQDGSEAHPERARL